MIVLLINIIRVIKRMKWAGHVAQIEEKRTLHWVLVGTFEGKSQLSRPRHRREDYVKLDVTGNRKKGRGLD